LTASTNINSTAIVTSDIKSNTITDVNNTTGASNQILYSTPSGIQWGNQTSLPPGGSEGDVQFRSSTGTFSGSTNMNYTPSTNTLSVTNIAGSGNCRFTRILDGFYSGGISGQILSSTGIGLEWINSTAGYGNSLSAVGPFSTTAPVGGSTPTVIFSSLTRGGRYRITTNVVAFPTSNDRVVTVETYVRQGSGNSWILALTSTSFMNPANVHNSFPSKSGYVNLTQGLPVEIFIRTGANTGSGSVDPVNIDLLECSI
jgi:hypothetical protein